MKSEIFLVKCLWFNVGLHEHGLAEQLNGKGYGGDIHVFNET